MQKKPGDVVVVRVSEQGDREDENFHSPKAQLARAKLWSKDQGNRVVNMMGAAFQCYAEVTGEKVAAARERVVARPVRARAAADGLARAPSQVRPAAGASGCAALWDVRVADGDQIRQRQLPLR
jgi:hypothetical protein